MNDASHIVVECVQGGPEWHALRAGRITASEFKHFRASALLKTGPRKGLYNDKAVKIIRRKAFERLSGVPLQGGEFETYAMRRGHELEPFARAAHERKYGVMVDRAGFVMTSDGKFGASADGFIGDDDGAEYKCLTDADEMLGIYEDDDISSFIDQVQGCMWITRRARWKFGLYCPELAVCGMDLKIIPVERDDDFINELELDLVKAEKAVSTLAAKLRANPLYHAPMMAAPDTE